MTLKKNIYIQYNIYMHLIFTYHNIFFFKQFFSLVFFRIIKNNRGILNA